MSLVVLTTCVVHPCFHLNLASTRFVNTNKFTSNRNTVRYTSVKQQRGRLQCRASASVQQGSETAVTTSHGEKLDITGMHHVGLLCENLERSMEFYQGVLGLEINPDRPADKLPYRGAWFWVGDEMIHLMELPNPDPVTGRPEHGGRDRHACVAIKSVEPLKQAFEKAGKGLVYPILAEEIRFTTSYNVYV